MIRTLNKHFELLFKWKKTKLFYLIYSFFHHPVRAEARIPESLYT